CGAAGCSDFPGVRKKRVRLAKIPAPLRGAFQNQLPGRRNTDSAGEVVELRFVAQPVKCWVVRDRTHEPRAPIFVSVFETRKRSISFTKARIDYCDPCL